MRVGELTLSPHVLKAKDIHMAKNRDKLLVVLYSSKTHDEGSRPQKIRITANRNIKFYKKRYFCLFKLVDSYIQIHGGYQVNSEQFFVFKDKSPVTAEKARSLLKDILTKLGLDP